MIIDLSILDEVACLIASSNPHTFLCILAVAMSEFINLNLIFDSALVES
jgi:hypothetical protein